MRWRWWRIRSLLLRLEGLESRGSKRWLELLTGLEGVTVAWGNWLLVIGHWRTIRLVGVWEGVLLSWSIVSTWGIILRSILLLLTIELGLRSLWLLLLLVQINLVGIPLGLVIEIILELLCIRRWSIGIMGNNLLTTELSIGWLVQILLLAIKLWLWLLLLVTKTIKLLLVGVSLVVVKVIRIQLVVVLVILRIPWSI